MLLILVSRVGRVKLMLQAPGVNVELLVCIAEVGDKHKSQFNCV